MRGAWRARLRLAAVAVCGLPAVATAAPPLELHQLKWYVHDSFGTLQDAQALVERAMSDAALSYQGDQGSDVGISDVACCSGFEAVQVELISDPALQEISSESEFDMLDDLCAAGGGGACAFLVQVLDWCGTPGVALGCADTPVCDTPPFDRLVLALSAEADFSGVLGETLAHERGHNACLDHVADHPCQLMAAFNGGGCLDAAECSRIRAAAEGVGADVCSCHTDAQGFRLEGASCADAVSGFCSGGVCGEPGSDASVRVLAAGGPEALMTAVPDDALALSGLTGGWRSLGVIGVEITGLAHAPQRDTLYAVTASDVLVTLDPGSGAQLSVVANLPGGRRYNALAFDPGPTPSENDDRLLAMRSDDDCVNRDCFGPDPVCDDELVSLDPDDGSVSPVVDICDAVCSGYQGLAYDPVNARLLGSSFESTALFQIGESNTPGLPCQLPDPVTDGAALAPLTPSGLAYHADSHQLFLVGSPLPGPQLAYSVVDPDDFRVSISHGIDAFTPGGLAALTVPEPRARGLTAGAGVALVALAAGRRRRASRG